MNSPVYIAAARRTPIAPKNGVLKEWAFHELAAHAIRPLLADLPPEASILSLIGGNALGAGGNPARLMALASGLPEHIPATTLDTQCCSGLDAVGQGFYRLRGSAVVGPSPAFVLAGGAESASQAPIRHNRLTNAAYEEAPFTPWPDRNPSMIQAAHRLEEKRPHELSAAYDWAIQSHQGNLANQSATFSLAPIPGGPSCDSLPRQLTAQLCARAQDMGPYNSTLMAPMADGAAFVAMTTTITSGSHTPLEVLDYCQIGVDPECPGLGAGFLNSWMADCEKRFQFDRTELLVSLMESFVAQVLVNIQDLKLNPELVNPWGGLLARGHPIGASGAVLVCDLFDHLQVGQFGLAAIPAAGGLVSGLLVRRVR